MYSENSATQGLRFLIAASGSGGHLLPALYIAKAIKELSPDARIEFVGSGRPLEKELIDKAGFIRHEVQLVGLKHRGIKGFLQFSKLLPQAALSIWKIISTLKPDVVIGVGGYVSFLPITIAFLRGVPRWIHEAELSPGMANAVLGFYSTKVSLAFKNAKMPRSSNTVFTGHPVRAELSGSVPAIIAGTEPRKILVLGGSQGSLAIDEAFLEFAPLLKERNFEIFHQCRADNLEKVTQEYAKIGLNARVAPFIHEITDAYAWADLIVSRSGAGAVMEIGIVNKPAILVPYPFAQANHQLENAKILVDAGKALLVEQGENFPVRLREKILELANPSAYHAMREKVFEGRVTNAASLIAQGCLDLAQERRH